MEQYCKIRNNQSVCISDVPILDYGSFMELNTDFLKDISCHCVHYFGFKKEEKKLQLFCCMANDAEGLIYISKAELVDFSDKTYPSFTAHHFAFHIFERELHENFGIQYNDHPWLKPVRYPVDRVNKADEIRNYPFYTIDSEELHEVGVGPIHAGIIEPGHFRFICNGEQILHLEIQLGFQHRGIENLMIHKPALLQKNMLAESIAGDTVAGHTTAFCNLWENLCGYIPGEDIQHARTLALEIERIAIHTGDLSAICTDIAYQLGSSVFGRLRTPVINSFQVWGGNRLAKGLLRPGRNQYPVTPELVESFHKVLERYEPDFIEMYQRMKNLPSVLARLERTGVVTHEQVSAIGAVGMAAKMSGISRDIRKSHPHDFYSRLNHEPVVKHHGDVYSRTQIRKGEILQSIKYVKYLLQNVPDSQSPDNNQWITGKDKLAISLVEGWRGEICHCAITNHLGELALYKIKDPSVHNWMALALAVRNNDISDFPICNKSFNLSYCGNDL